MIYANTLTELYRIDATTFIPRPVGVFTFPSDDADHAMGDIAVTGDGDLYGITVGTFNASPALYRIDQSTAACSLVDLVGTGGSGFDGLATIPGPQEQLGAMTNVGGYIRIVPRTGVSTRNAGFSGLIPSGDLAWFSDHGLIGTISSSTSENLVDVDPVNGGGSIIAPIGSGQLHTYGLAIVSGTIIGFDNDGDISVIEPNTGRITRLLNHSDNAWNGAAAAIR